MVSVLNGMSVEAGSGGSGSSVSVDGDPMRYKKVLVQFMRAPEPASKVAISRWKAGSCEILRRKLMRSSAYADTRACVRVGESSRRSGGRGPDAFEWCGVGAGLAVGGVDEGEEGLYDEDV